MMRGKFVATFTLRANCGEVVARMWCGSTVYLASASRRDVNYYKNMSTFIQSLALKFGTAEYLALFASVLLLLAVLTSRNLLRAFGAILTGGLLAMIGTDVNSGVSRFTGDVLILADGIPAGLVLIAFVLLPRLAVVHAPRASLAIYLQGRLSLRHWSLLNALWRNALLVLMCVMLPFEEFFDSPQIMFGLTAILSIMGVWFYRLEIPSVVLYFALAYGTLIEEQCRRALLISHGDVSQILQRPTVIGFVGFMFVTLLLHFAWAKIRTERDATQACVACK
jgi:TctA family transporter